MVLWISAPKKQKAARYILRFVILVVSRQLRLLAQPVVAMVTTPGHTIRHAVFGVGHRDWWCAAVAGLRCRWQQGEGSSARSAPVRTQVNVQQLVQDTPLGGAPATRSIIIISLYQPTARVCIHVQ